MPPAASLVYPQSSIDELVFELGGIEVEAVQTEIGDEGSHVQTRILVPENRFEYDSNSIQQRSPVPSHPNKISVRGSPCDESTRYRDLAPSSPGGISLVDSMDSLDEIPEDSDEAKLLKTLAQKAHVSTDGSMRDVVSNGRSANPQDPFFMDSSEANKYLDVLDRHLEETDPECISLSELDNGPDDPHPHKNGATVEDIIDHLLDEAC